MTATLSVDSQAYFSSDPGFTNWHTLLRYAIPSQTLAVNRPVPFPSVPLHPGDERIVLGGADPNGLREGADVVAPAADAAGR